MQLTEIWTYPLKSGMGLSQHLSFAGLEGLEGDRRWMVADLNGKFVTGRQLPKLVTIKALPHSSGLTLAMYGQPSLKVSINQFTQALDSQVWDDRFSALTGCQEANDWLSEALEMSLQLVYIGPQSQREREVLGGQALGFADGYPYLLLGENSVADLNLRLQAAGQNPVDVRQFRPNLVVDGADPYAEDGWSQVRIGEVVFDLPKLCTRCVFTTVNPDSGFKHPQQEPLRTLSQYRKQEMGVCLGQNLVARNTGILRLGDPVEILA